MDLSLTTEDRAFQKEVRTFLQQALTPELCRAGARTTSIFSDYDAALEWQRILHEKEWLAIDWPEEYGGTGWSVSQQAIFRVECVRAGAPTLVYNGLLLLGSILIKYGTDEQKELLPKILSTEDQWCQGFSEPNAGSDLASLQTRAEKSGDHYLVNGSKIWTSFAHRANKMFCLVRTSKEGKPQAGISFLLMDLNVPGITVTPIVGLDEEVEQCQVFMEDVRVPTSNLVGNENQGWEIAKSLLEIERGAFCYYPGIEKQLKLIKALAAKKPHFSSPSYLDDPAFNTQLATLEIDNLALEFMENRVSAQLAEGADTGALSSLIKVSATELSQRVDELALNLRGSYLAVSQNYALNPSYTDTTIGPEQGITIMNYYLNNRASTIYGGSAQIQRNIIAKLVLGL